MGARTTVVRPLEWMDTDAAGIWHYSTVIRFSEHAELALHDELGIAERTFGRTPRVHVAFDFREPVRFGDAVATTIDVSRVGRTSIAYRVELRDERDVTRLFAQGEVVTVLLDVPGGRPVEVDAALRAVLQG